MTSSPHQLYRNLQANADPSVTRDTVAVVAADPARFAEAFYGRLFARAPGLRTLFPAELDEQGLKLAHTLCLLVSAQDRAESLVPILHDMGRRHAGYGVRPFHYRIVGTVLVETLAELNGDAFTPQAQDAWERLYAWVARQMQAG